MVLFARIRAVDQAKRARAFLGDDNGQNRADQRQGDELKETGCFEGQHDQIWASGLKLLKFYPV